MIQITFQPALDSLHTVFRMLRLRSAYLSSPAMLHIDHLRILDFYLTFPHRLAAIRLKPAHRRIKATAKKYEDSKPYGDMPDDRSLLERMQPFQVAAIQTLLTKGLLCQINTASRVFSFKYDVPIPEQLKLRVDKKNAEEKELMEALAILAQEYTVFGVGGLKDRTGLMEHRHDAV